MCVLRYLVNISFTFSSSFSPYASHDERTILYPPNGIIARRRGASVCNPTMISLSLSMYPALCESTADGVDTSAESNPLLRRSCFMSSRTCPQIFSVLSVAGSRNAPSPS